MTTPPTTSATARRSCPSARVIDSAFTWGEDRHLRLPFDQGLIYETHVRGFTKRHPHVPDRLQGTFRGLIQPEVIKHIKSLGVTAIELLPIHNFVNDDHLLNKGLTNFWGYNTLSFFAPDRRFASEPDFAFSEFKEMVAHLHANGLEVILDVVYNHTAEGNEFGPTFSFKGIDNASYYRLLQGEPALLHQRHRHRQHAEPSPPARAADGDGQPALLGRGHARRRVPLRSRHHPRARDHGFDEGGGFLDSCRQDPVLSAVKLIAEPWDCGPGGYQVGRFPPGWAEWNDRFRDNVRSFWQGENGTLPLLAKRLTASAESFNHRGRKAWASVNFVTAHDGFTLNDLVSYNEKHNDANGEEGRDGSSDNRSWNCGAEGATDDPEVKALRERQKRNILATLFFSQGLPMLLAGDEFGRTQSGNNNAYCQDNEISWVNWDLDEAGHALYAFVQKLTRLRQDYPILRRERFLSGHYNEELDVKDVTWLKPNGDEIDDGGWSDTNALSMGVLLDGRAQPTGIKKRGSDSTLLMFFNGYHDVVQCKLIAVPGAKRWVRLLDTNQPTAEESNAFELNHTYDVTGRSVVLFKLQG